jgi:hypothetical protein
MAVVNTKSTTVSNYDAQPRVLTSGYIAGANDTVNVGVVAAGSADSIGSTYRFAFLPSGVRIEDIQMMNDATTAGTMNLGVYCNTQQGLNLGLCLNTWNATTAYVPGNVVQYAGVVYYCTTGNTNSAPPSGNWTTGNAIIAAPGALPIPNANLILQPTATSTAAAHVVWTSVYTPSIGGVGAAAANATLRIWELLGMASDPEYMFHLVGTLAVATTAAGNIALQTTWVR